MKVNKSKMNSEEKGSMKELDGWVEQLMECKQLSENQVSLQVVVKQVNSKVAELWELWELREPMFSREAEGWCTMVGSRRRQLRLISGRPGSFLSTVVELDYGKGLFLPKAQ